MKYLGLLALLLALSAQAEDGSCFSAHLREAIQLNKARAPLYKALSQGESGWLSWKLVLSERLSLMPAGALEWQARAFWKAGIPILCADFVPMAKTPAFKEHFDFKAPHLADYQEPPVDRWKRDLSIAVHKMSFNAVHLTARRFLRELGEPQGFHCMVRHVLDSVARVAYLAPQYEARARKLGLRQSPESLARKNLWLHLQGLSLARDMDRQAAPIQARGIPILCQDVPPIDLTPTLAE